MLPLLRDCEVENRDLLVLPVLLLIFFSVKKKTFVQSVKSNTMIPRIPRLKGP